MLCARDQLQTVFLHTTQEVQDGCLAVSHSLLLTVYFNRERGVHLAPNVARFAPVRSRVFGAEIRDHHQGLGSIRSRIGREQDIAVLE